MEHEAKYRPPTLIGTWPLASEKASSKRKSRRWHRPWSIPVLGLWVKHTGDVIELMLPAASGRSTLLEEDVDAPAPRTFTFEAQERESESKSSGTTMKSAQQKGVQQAGAPLPRNISEHFPDYIEFFRTGGDR